MSEGTDVVAVCCITGRIAGDSEACGDCDPCGAAYRVTDVVKRLLKEKDEWREKYAESAGTVDALSTEITRLREALERAERFIVRCGAMYWADDAVQSAAADSYLRAIRAALSPATEPK